MTTWSQQNPPAAVGKSVNGLTTVQLPPPSVLRLANQLPVTNRSFPEAAAVGSPTVAVRVLVAASPRPMFWINRTLATGDLLAPLRTPVWSGLVGHGLGGALADRAHGLAGAAEAFVPLVELLRGGRPVPGLGVLSLGGPDGAQMLRL